MPRPAAFADFPADLAALAAYGPYQAVVDRIVDGDTFVAVADAGLDETPTRYIRVTGYSAAERWQDNGPAATAHLARTLPPGTPIVLATEKKERFTAEAERRSLVRYLARVTLGGGRDLAALLRGEETDHA